ncbi:sodium:solute symporter family protein [Pseudomaricurvus alkylphenolicus]|uniref:sodium:solute symporter family transporter n=1 Tax=Pseudomaricurvus alkylphenolicus TaxID=1306991 RepID=UPI001421EEE0|nr:sodium:solute symporter family protein [Pseudomaricurvus alkylphenolicus]NIB41832.1 sodium:solute symporter family protein [Pseudomaricurvus alkylphenolicus]
MSAELFKYLVVGFYVGLTLWLSWIGMRKTQDIKGFSIGNKDMSAWVIGVTMAASISSTATFVINPGFVYVHGVSAFVHYAIAGTAGIMTAFLLLTRRFRQLGDESGAITIPDWIYQRYRSRSLSVFFAVINLLSVAFVVLILVGCSLLLSELFPISQTLSLTLILLFVFSYVLMGGSYAHAYTNTFQGIMMIGVSLFVFVQGYHHFQGDIGASLSGIGEQYASVFNADSNLYHDFFSVFLSGFVITFALMMQPHILTKMLYLKNDRDVNRFLVTTFLAGACFMLMLAVGFYARLKGLEIERQDGVVVSYIASEFAAFDWGPYALVFISITLLAAGMSTLDGILVSLSAMVVKDLYLPFSGKEGFEQGSGLMLSRVVLVLVGLLAYLVALDPPKLVGLFAQKGVYGLAAASLVPIVLGTLLPRQPPILVAWGSAATGLVTHLLGILLFGIENPAVAATYAIFASALVAAALMLFGSPTPTESDQACARLE